MKTFRFVMTTPDGNFYEGDIVKVSVRGAEGDLAVMANHTPFVTSVKPCEGVLYEADGNEKRFRLERGLLSVTQAGVALMSGDTDWV